MYKCNRELTLLDTACLWCSFLLSFALAELEEARKAFPAVHAIFNSLTNQLQTDLTKIRQSTTDEVATVLAALEEKFSSMIGMPQLGLEGNEMDSAETKRSQGEEKRKAEEEIRERRSKELEEAEKAAGLVWIMYMRFARRSEVSTRMCVLSRSQSPFA